jgi:hypothetical protein
MGKYLLKDLDCSISGLTHKNYERARQLVETKGEEYFTRAISDVESALRMLYREEEISLQQLSATFRRSDLIEKLDSLVSLN